jgi:hypothetical protein
MAVDPNTGQSVINIPGFDQRNAQFIDPSAIGSLVSQQQQLGQQSQLAQAMMQRGYIPNSGFGGALSQMVNAFMGMKMLKDQQGRMAGINQKILEATQTAAQKAHDQKIADDKFATDEAIRKEVGVDSGKKQFDFAHQGEEAALKGATAKAESDAQFGNQAKLEQMRAASAANVAQIGANATKGRAYPIQDANGNTVMVALQPDGTFKQVYQTTTPGGGKLTPQQQEENKVDVSTLESLGKRITSAKQLQTNLQNYVASYTGADPKSLEGKSPEELANIMEKAGTSISKMIPIGNRGLDAISNDIAINAAGTKRETPTEDIIRAEQANTVSRYKTAAENAAIIRNHANDIKELLDQSEKLRAQIQSRQAPGSGRVPQAQPAAPAATPNVTHIWTPDGGLQQVGQ